MLDLINRRTLLYSLSALVALLIVDGELQSAPPTKWQMRIPQMSALKDLSAEELWEIPTPNVMDQLYQHLEALCSRSPDSGIQGLEALIAFKNRIEMEWDRLGHPEFVVASMVAFDQSFSRLVRLGLTEGRYSILELVSLTMEYEVVFYSRTSSFSNWVLKEFLPERLRALDDQPTLLTQCLIEIRNLYLSLYAKHSQAIQDLHREFKNEFWVYVYSAEQRSFLMSALGNGIAGFQDAHAIVIKSARLFDVWTKLYFLEHLIESSKDPAEIIRAIEIVGAPHYQSFPTYRVDTFWMDAPAPLISTIDMSVAQRLTAFLRYEAMGNIPTAFAIGALYLPYQIIRLFPAFRPSRESIQEKELKDEFKRRFWSLSLRGWQRVKELESSRSRLDQLRPAFRRASMLSATQELVFKCRRVVTSPLRSYRH